MRHSIRNLYKFSKETKKEILVDAISASFQSWTDQLARGHIARKRVQKPLMESILDCLESPRPHFTIIERHDIDNNPFYEFAISSMGIPDYHVWIYVSVNEAYKIFDKFGLDGKT